MNRLHRTRNPSEIPGWGSAPGWGQPLPGWSPLIDHGPLPLRMAGSVARWWWPTLTLAGFGTVVGIVLGHDDPTTPGLSTRSLATITLAALVVVLLTIHRTAGPGALARAAAEYTVVALLAGLLATAGAVVDQQPTDPTKPSKPNRANAQAAAGDDQPAVLRAVTKVLGAGAALVRGVAGAVRWLINLWRQADQQTTPTGEAMPAPPRPPSPAHPLDLEVPPLMWSSLPSNLRTVLGTALLLGLGVAVAAFTLSFFALRDAAADPALAWGQGHAWLFPIGVDMALVFFEVLLLGASMVRIHDHGQVVQYPRAIPFLLMLVAAAGTLYFNATHVPEQVRPIALAVPVASILVTLGLAYLLKMLAAASGAAAIHLAPPDQGPNRIVRSSDVLHGELVRDPTVPGLHGPAGASGQLPWQHQQQAPQIPQNGHGELGEATKRQQIEAYLAGLDAGQLATTTRSQVAAELTARGMPVDETYAGRILGEWRVRHPAAGGARKRGSRGR